MKYCRALQNGFLIFLLKKAKIGYDLGFICYQLVGNLGIRFCTIKFYKTDSNKLRVMFQFAELSKRHFVRVMLLHGGVIFRLTS